MACARLGYSDLDHPCYDEQTWANAEKNIVRIEEISTSEHTDVCRVQQLYSGHTKAA